jgi:Fur family ferric uptake transcriptional regulator
VPRSNASIFSRTRAATETAATPVVDIAAPLSAAGQAAATYLSAHRIKPTRVRVQVLETLRARTPANGLISAEDIYRAVLLRGERIVLATIYNVLSLLADMDLIERYRLGEGPALFSPRRDQRFVALLICGDCGQVRGLHTSALQQQLDTLARANGFAMTEPTVVLRGRCITCATCAPLPTPTPARLS